MVKKILKFFAQEEVLIPALMLVALIIAFSPFAYEVAAASRSLDPSRYPLFEDNFPPDQRVYLSRMREGFEGKWLVFEKYTAELHRPSILHISYLLMGKLAGWLGIDPVQAYPFWRLVATAFMMGSGYFFLLQFFKKKWQRIGTFALFVFVGNLPFPAKGGLSLLGIDFGYFLGWYTFFDPVRRLFFHPHYNLAAGFLSLSLAFSWRGIELKKRSEFVWAGIFGFLAGIVLPTNLLLSVLVAGFLSLAVLVGWQKSFSSLTFWQRLKRIVLLSWPNWLGLVLALALFYYSLSYFPWKVHSLADSEKRFMGFDFWQVVLGLGSTGLLGLIGAIYVLARRKSAGLISGIWLISIALMVLTFLVFPISNAYRPLQIELHLPLAVTSVIILQDLAGLFRRRRQLVFGLMMIFLLLPSILIWPMSLKSQRIFVRDKLKAGYPLVPKLPFVVYPIRDAMEAIFWLRDNTNHDTVVLSAETLGSMIPAYAGNFVYLGHGNQTVYFQEKMVLMKNFYQGLMSLEEAKEFLRQNRISYIFWGPEEQEIAGYQETLSALGLKLVFQNQMVNIYRHE